MCFFYNCGVLPLPILKTETLEVGCRVFFMRLLGATHLLAGCVTVFPFHSLFPSTNLEFFFSRLFFSRPCNLRFFFSHFPVTIWCGDLCIPFPSDVRQVSGCLLSTSLFTRLPLFFSSFLLSSVFLQLSVALYPPSSLLFCLTLFPMGNSVSD